MLLPFAHVMFIVVHLINWFVTKKQQYCLPLVLHSVLINRDLVWHYNCPMFFDTISSHSQILEELNYYYHLSKAFEKLHIILGERCPITSKYLKRLTFTIKIGFERHRAWLRVLRHLQLLYQQSCLRILRHS